MTERASRERNAKPVASKARGKPADKQPGGSAVELPWSVPITVAEVPETGRHVELAPSEATRQAIAKVADVVALPRLEAIFELTRRGSEGLRVEGRVSATVVQNCVVTLDPIENEIDEPVDLMFRPARELAASGDGDRDGAGSKDDTGHHPLDAAEPPETLVDGKLDLGILATEFLLLGVDPYPRKEGVVFDAPPAGDPAGHPFAALEALKKGRDSEGR
jgi:hypothetical protein